MPKLRIEEPHVLSAEEARARVEGLRQVLADRLALAVSWRSHIEAKIERTGATGTIPIAPDRFLVVLDFSFALSPIKEKIDGWIREGLRAAADTKSAPLKTPEQPAEPEKYFARQQAPCGCAYLGSKRVTQCEAHAARDARLAPPAA